MEKLPFTVLLWCILTKPISEILSDCFRSRHDMRISSGPYPWIIEWCQKHPKAADTFVPAHTSMSIRTASTAFLLGKQKNLRWTYSSQERGGRTFQAFPGDSCWLLVTLDHPKSAHTFRVILFSDPRQQVNEGCMRNATPSGTSLLREDHAFSLVPCTISRLKLSVLWVSVIAKQTRLCFLPESQGTLQRKRNITIPV